MQITRLLLCRKPCHLSSILAQSKGCICCRIIIVKILLTNSQFWAYKLLGYLWEEHRRSHFYYSNLWHIGTAALLKRHHQLEILSFLSVKSGFICYTCPHISVSSVSKAFMSMVNLLVPPTPTAQSNFNLEDWSTIHGGENIVSKLQYVTFLTGVKFSKQGRDRYTHKHVHRDQQTRTPCHNVSKATTEHWSLKSSLSSAPPQHMVQDTTSLNTISLGQVSPMWYCFLVPSKCF